METKMSHSQDQVLKQFQQRLEQRLGHHLKRIILFGSRARGDDVPGSDYDCLAILDQVSPWTKDAIDQVTGEILYEYYAVFSVFPLAEDRYRQPTYNPFLSNARREGIVL